MKINVRYFKIDICENTNKPDVIEINESEFLDIDRPIEYERNTIFENGVNQICLTKNTFE